MSEIEKDVRWPVDRMEFPKNPYDFVKSYAFKDEEEIYTNGSILVPLFRVEQMLEHYYRNTEEQQ